MSVRVAGPILSLPWKVEAASPKIRIFWRICFSISLILSVGLSLTRGPWWDEGVFGDPAATFASHNHLGSASLTETGYLPFPGVHQYTYWQMPGYLLLTGLLFKFAGVSVVAMRLVNIPLGLLYLWAWRGFILRLTGDANWSLIVASTIAVDYSFVGGVANGRMDMLCAATGMASLTFLLEYAGSLQLRAAALSGLCLAVSVLSHPLGMLYGLLWLVSLVCLLWLGRKSLQYRQLPAAAACFVLPFFVLLGCWGLYIAQDAPVFLAQMGSGSSYRLRTSYNPLRVIPADFTYRYFTVFISFKAKAALVFIPLLSSLAVVLTPSLRRSHALVAMVGLTALMFCGLAYIDNQSLPPYFVHTMPWLTALMCATLYWMANKSSALRWAAIAVLGAFLLFAVMGNAARIQRRQYQADFMPVIELLKGPVARGAVVMGGSELGFGLGFGHVIDDRYMGFYAVKAEPEYFVMDMYYGPIGPAFEEGIRFRDQRLAKNYTLVLANPDFKVYQRR